jgi:hemolysin activation/secretion protein
LTAANAVEEPAAQSREQPGTSPSTPPAKDQPAAQPKGQPAPSKDQPTAQNQGTNQNKPIVRFEFDEYRIEGADHMAQIDVEEAVYPFLGPGRTAEDVEKARAALEKAYQSKGYQTVAVSIPEQNAQNGIVVLKVVEAKVARLRVKGSRYFDLDKIKDKAPSVAEGKLPNLNEVTKDIIALNQLPDRKVTPASLKPELLDFDDVLRLLRDEVSNAGGQSEWARKKSVDRVSISYVLNERRPPSPRLLKALGLRKVVAYTRCGKAVP